MAICVLTGDIVGSTGLTHAQLKRANTLLADAYSEISLDGNDPFDSFRGDGWQMAFPDSRKGLRFALLIRATLRSESDAFETRIALAENHGSAMLFQSNSATYVASGRTLDAMPSDRFMGHASGGALHAATVLADYISHGWTVAQARAIRPFLTPRTRTTQQHVADTLAISRQAVGQALEAAGYNVIHPALTAIEEQAL